MRKDIVLLLVLPISLLEKETKTLELLSNGSVDGVIISSAAQEDEIPQHAKHLRDLSENQIPLVMFDRVSDLINCDKVVVDDFEAGYKATKHLIETGCKTIAIVNPIADSIIGRFRVEGYKKALLENNFSFDEKLVEALNPKEDLELTLSLLLNYKKIDAIIALDEITAVKVQNIVKSKGYHVPSDISLIGFTNGELSKYVTPAITMVSQHGKYIGELSANLLIDRIENTNDFLSFTTKLVKTSLIERESTLSI